MTKKKIRVSRQGLTRCPSCKAHIAIAPVLAQTACPFCDSVLAEALGTTGNAMDRILGSGRSALIAASLLGMPALGACGDDTDDDAPPTDDAGTTDIGPDTQPIPPYGIPSPPEDVQLDLAPDVPVADPVYGMPADAFGPEDTAGPEDAGPEDATEPDAFEEEKEDTSDGDTSGGDASEDADADTEKQDPTPAPVYGMPPNPSD